MGLDLDANAPIDPSSVTPADVTVTDTNTSQVVTASGLDIDGIAVHVTFPAIDLDLHHVYHVTLTGAVDSFGVPAASTTASFTVTVVSP